MDPISITCIAVAAGIVVTSFGRFIKKTYSSYKSHSNEHGFEMTSEETSVDGAHKKTTLKMHGNSNHLNIMGAEHKEHGDPEAVKALSSISMILSGAFGSNHTATSIDSTPSTVTDDSESKHSIVSKIKNGTSSAIKALESECSSQEGGDVDKRDDTKTISDSGIDLSSTILRGLSCKSFKVVPLSGDESNNKDVALSFFAAMSQGDVKISSTRGDEAKEWCEDGNVTMLVHRKNIAENKLNHIRSSDSGSAGFFDARENDDVRNFDDDLSLASMNFSGDSDGYFSNE